MSVMMVVQNGILDAGAAGGAARAETKLHRAAQAEQIAGCDSSTSNDLHLQCNDWPHIC